MNTQPQNIKVEDLIQKTSQNNEEIQPSMIADSGIVNNEISNQLSTLEQQYQAEIISTAFGKDNNLMQPQIQNFNSAQEINMRQDYYLNEETFRKGQQQRPIISSSETNPYTQNTKTEDLMQKPPQINEEVQPSIVADLKLMYNQKSKELKIVEDQNKEEISAPENPEKDKNISQLLTQDYERVLDINVIKVCNLNEETFQKCQLPQSTISDSQMNPQTQNTKTEDLIQQLPLKEEEIQSSIITDSIFMNNERSKQFKIVDEKSREEIGPIDTDKNLAQSLIQNSTQHTNLSLRSVSSLDYSTIKKGSKQIPVILPQQPSQIINSQITDKLVISKDDLSEISKYFYSIKQQEQIVNQQIENHSISNNKTNSLNQDYSNNNDMITQSPNFNESERQNEINLQDSTVQIHKKEEIINFSDNKSLQKQNNPSTVNNISNIINDEVDYDAIIKNGQPEVCDIDINESFGFNKNSTKIEQEIEVELNKNNFLLEIKDYPENQKKIFNFIWQELEKKGYYLQKYLAKGGEGILFVGYDQKSIERVFKIILDSDQNLLEEEISIMKRFEDGFNIIKYIDFIKVSDDIAVIVLEKCQYSLKEELELFRDAKKTFKLENFFKIILDLFDGLIQLRLFKILHLDIKPDNILMKEEGYYVYTDFGLSLQYSNNISSDQVKGYTKRYAPNEQLEKEKNNLIQYKSDVYSLGETIKLIVEIFKGVNQPYEIINEFEELILKKMLEQDVENRVDCVKCHDQLIELLIKYNLSQILNLYSQKIQNIVEQFPYDENKDIPYSLEAIIYYYSVELKIVKLEIQKTGEKYQQKQHIHYQITELIIYIKKIRLSHIHLQLGKINLNYLKEIILILLLLLIIQDYAIKILVIQKMLQDINQIH